MSEAMLWYTVVSFEMANMAVEHSSVQDGCLKLANFKHPPWTNRVNVRNNKISQIGQKVKEIASLV